MIAPESENLSVVKITAPSTLRNFGSRVFSAILMGQHLDQLQDSGHDHRASCVFHRAAASGSHIVRSERDQRPYDRDRRSIRHRVV